MLQLHLKFVKIQAYKNLADLDASRLYLLMALMKVQKRV